ncbi:transporter substrate-binding domain-containing protein [Kaarinaea lacus]
MYSSCAVNKNYGPIRQSCQWPSKNFLKFLLLGVYLLQLIACGSSEDAVTPANTPAPNKSFENYIELGDLPALQQRKKLRVLLTDVNIDVPYLPRQGLPVHFETDLVTRFAEQYGLEPEWIYVENFDDLLPMLVEGKGDLAAANLTITGQRKEQVAFSVPVTIVTEQIITRTEDNIKSAKELQGRSVAVQKSSSYWETVEKLRQEFPKINIQEVEGSRPLLEILDGVANNEFDVTVADSNLVQAILSVQPKLKVAFDISKERPVAWAVRPEANLLLQEINRFITAEKLTARRHPIYKEDLAEIKKRKVLRVLTRNNAATYFLWRGELMGFEYELVRHFADSQGLRLEMIVAPSREALTQWLLEGKGDMIAASITIPKSNEDSALMYSRAYDKVYEIVVGRTIDKEVENINELRGRSFHVRKSSSYWRTLTELNKNGAALKIKLVPENEETEEIIAKVATGDYDLTLSDSNILDIEMTWRDDVKGILNLGEEMSHGWVVREDAPKLLETINQYIGKEYRGEFYNITRRKYFEKPKTIAKRLEERVDRGNNSSLSPYDEFAKEFAAKYNFDWRMIVAQMYQESRFDPQAKSWAGARGLMQVMPRTASQLGIKNLKDPKQSVEAGVKYLDWLRDRFEPELSVKDRMWLTLAAYNAGAGHVHDARSLARKMGWEPNRWFGNVERAMLLLSKRKYAKNAKHGYVRGSEPVTYVREIRDRYDAYVKLAQPK